MDRINSNISRLFESIESLNPNNSGALFSIILHFVILLFAVGLPNFFGPKDIYVPNIVPIEILNITETTNIEKKNTEKKINKNTPIQQKKFNSSENTEIQKQFDISEKSTFIDQISKPNVEIEVKEKNIIKEKKILEMEKKNINKKIPLSQETLKSDSIKPKIKPKQLNEEITKKNSDLKIKPNEKKDIKIEKKEEITEPKKKLEKDFSITSMLKDLRNEKSNFSENNEINEEESKLNNDNQTNENLNLSISEIDLLRQQLSSCWNAPAGAVIDVGMKVRISAKVQQNMKVFENSVRIIDTNISKSNPFYGPITDSAMRTLLNPECNPLKLPKDKFKLWKNLTITFDYSIMKGY